jgi:Family of unknown function (DUF6600)
MKKIIISAIAVMLLLVCFQSCTTYETQSNSNENQYDGYNTADLNNYGEWIQTSYGLAWRPYVAEGWAPFDYGYWTYADNNWTWISYEPFGWIVYHYGNWYDDPTYGWVWFPSSNQWSPARVEWVRYDNYIGWAPIPPAHVAAYGGNPWEANQNKYWHVVKSQDFTNDNVHNYIVSSPLRNNMGARNSTTERTAPSPQEIQKTTGKSVPVVKLQHQRINLRNRNVEKTVLPPQDEKKVQDNSTKVRNNVLVPRDEYKKREAKQNNQQKPNQNNQRETERKDQNGSR